MKNLKKNFFLKDMTLKTGKTKQQTGIKVEFCGRDRQKSEYM